METNGKNNLKILYQFIISNKKQAIDLLNKYGIETKKQDANSILNFYINNTDNIELYKDLIDLMQQKKMYQDGGSANENQPKRKGIEAEAVADTINKAIDFANSIKNIVEKKREEKNKSEKEKTSDSKTTNSNEVTNIPSKDSDTKVTITISDDEEKKKKTRKIIIVSTLTLIVISVASFFIWTYIKNKNKSSTVI